MSGHGFRLSDSEIAQKSCPRGADTGRHGEHRSNAGHDDEVHGPPFRWTVIDRLADGGGHRKDAGIATGDDTDIDAGRGSLQRHPGAIQFLAIVGRLAGLVAAQRQAVEIGP